MMPSLREYIDDSKARSDYIASTAYGRITPEVVAALVSHGPWIEVAAGTGALTAAIKLAGGWSIASDDYSWNSRPIYGTPNWVGSVGRVHKLDGMRAASHLKRHPRIGLLMSWPYMEEWPTKAARQIPIGQKLAYIGEGMGGCTGADSLYELLDDDFTLLEEVNFAQWYGLHDNLSIYQRLR